MRKLFLIFLFGISACYCQDTIFFKIEPTKPVLISNIRYEGELAYITSYGSDKESKIERNSILKVKFFEVKNNVPTISDSLRTEQYCLIVGTAMLFSTKVKITIDFGEEKDFWKGQDYIRDQTGKAINFNSMVDALNYMNGLGWEFISAYPMSSNSGTCYHYLMKRKIPK